jgi:hypothetical protein
MAAANQHGTTGKTPNAANPTKTRRAGRKPLVYAYLRAILERGLSADQRRVLGGLARQDARVGADLAAGRVSCRMLAELLDFHTELLDRMGDEARATHELLGLEPREWLSRLYWQLRSHGYEHGGDVETGDSEHPIGQQPRTGIEDLVRSLWITIADPDADHSAEVKKLRKRASRAKELQQAIDGLNAGMRQRRENDWTAGELSRWRRERDSWRRQLGKSFLEHPEKRERLVADWMRNMRQQDPQLDADLRAAGLKPRGRRGVPLSPPR